MKKKILVTMMAGSFLMMYMSSCYNNKEDILLPSVSFLGDVVPIMTSGACGCHNNNNANGSNYNAFPFTRFDTVYRAGGGIVSITRRVDYGAIIARVDTLGKWANDVIGHPGAGTVYLTSRQKEIIKKWVAQGQPYDGGSAACDATGPVKYNADILPIYNTTCKSSGCHGVGGRGPVLDYNKMVADKTILTAMMASGGSSGHPGGTIGLTSCTVTKFNTWIAAGQPQ